MNDFTYLVWFRLIFFCLKHIVFLLSQAKDNELTTPGQNKAKQLLQFMLQLFSRHVLNLYSRHDETVNEVHSSIKKMLASMLSLFFNGIFAQRIHTIDYWIISTSAGCHIIFVVCSRATFDTKYEASVCLCWLLLTLLKILLTVSKYLML